MKFLVILFVTCLVLKIESHNIYPPSVEDYHWRDYNGLVPTDAIPGGLTEAGETTYIGQFTMRGEYEGSSSKLVTLVANIFKRSTTAVGSYNAKIRNSTHDSNTKILCSPFPDRYKWYSPNEQIPPRCHVIVGGLEDRLALLVARTQVGNDTVVGKIFVNERHDSYILVPDVANQLELILEKSELLMYCY